MINDQSLDRSLSWFQPQPKLFLHSGRKAREGAARIAWSTARRGGWKRVTFRSQIYCDIKSTLQSRAIHDWLFRGAG